MEFRDPCDGAKKRWNLNRFGVVTEFGVDGLRTEDHNKLAPDPTIIVILRSMHPKDDRKVFKLTADVLDDLCQLARRSVVKAVQVKSIHHNADGEEYLCAWQLSRNLVHEKVACITEQGVCSFCPIAWMVGFDAFIDRIDCTTRILDEESFDFLFEYIARIKPIIEQLLRSCK